MQLFVNDLTVMDFSYLCAERGIVGESWIVDVILSGNLNDESMIQDFSIVKKNLKRLIDHYVDHKLLVPAESKNTQQKQDELGQVEVCFTTNAGDVFALNCPADAYAFIYASEIEMASVGEYLKEIIATHLPDNVANIELKLRTEVIETPYYHYTHGLKKHDGNCQRIAHGHRSRIDLYRNDNTDLESQAYWAQRWCDIYIASSEDAVKPESLKMTQYVEDYTDYLCYAYESSQGYFEIVLPRKHCEEIDTDSTVECLAQYLLEQQQQRFPGDAITVLAYEGVGKGAMVSS